MISKLLHSHADSMHRTLRILKLLAAIHIMLSNKQNPEFASKAVVIKSSFPSNM
jgi:hypothetical protein